MLTRKRWVCTSSAKRRRRTGSRAQHHPSTPASRATGCQPSPMDPSTLAQAQLAGPATGAPFPDEGNEADPMPQPMDTDGQWAVAWSP